VERSDSPQISHEEAMKRIMASLARPDFAELFEVRREDGTIPMLVALTSDTVQSVYDRVARHGDAANVVVADDEGFWLVEFGRAKAPTIPAGSDRSNPVHPETTMGMLVTSVDAIHPDRGQPFYLTLMEATVSQRPKILVHSARD